MSEYYLLTDTLTNTKMFKNKDWNKMTLNYSFLSWKTDFFF